MDNPVTFTPDVSSQSSRRTLSSMPASDATPAGFNFITVDPSSRTESSSSRTLIRANAGRYIWKRRKAGSKETGRAKPYERPGQQPPAPLSSPPENTGVTAKPDPDSKEILPTNGEEEAENENAVVLLKREPSSESGGLSASLSHGLKSPMMTFFGTEIPEDIVRRTIKYSASVVMTKMLPQDTSPESPKISDIWLSSALRSPALLSAFLYGTLSHEFVLERMQSGTPSRERRQKLLQIMVAENESIRRINQALQDPASQKTDELLMAVFFMGYSRYDEAIFSPGRDPHKSPLNDIQWANIYSYLDYDEVHVMGLIRLLEIRGGIDAIRLNGLAEMMSLATIMFSSKFIRKPLFPYVPIIKTNGRHRQPDWPHPIQYLLEMYKGGDYSKMDELGLPSELITLFKDMYSYNAVIELYMQGIFTGSFVSSDAPIMADRRNSIQHRALSLPSADEIGMSSECPTYEPLRLATLIYCLLTIFPLVPIMAPYSQLTMQLRQALFTQSLPRAWKSVPELFIWTLVVGGIASTKPETVTWFAAMLNQVSTATNLSTWPEVKKILKSVLWLSTICDEKAEELWRKADGLRAQVRRHQEQQQRQLHEVPVRLRAESAG
ncbi:hypothetical protein UA08_08836 [Talaromyces atroroseus]|uniref:Uncharacterized protein n=1 Tax=Talaromyces atroroseus TaxID=1441469 RepID=A0A225AQS4_TALAT|nr:hypothetical protein UA08_08836 [Talaromyces atroroseus]OKL55807.1 hypothetical protein UA08_08836 [Talaromyces atroroseus]